MSVNYKYNVNLRPYNTLALSCQCHTFAEIDRVEDYGDALSVAQQQHLPIMILSGGSNVLLPERLDALVIRPNHTQIDILSEDETTVLLKVGAGLEWHQFVLWSLDQGYYGLENLVLIPGRIGASPVQNIGAYGVEIAQYIDSVDCIDLEHGTSVVLSNQACCFGYRDSIFKHQQGRYLITAVVIRLSKLPQIVSSYGIVADHLPDQPTPQDVAQAIIHIRQSKLPDPIDYPNVGSFFKNPIVDEACYIRLKAAHPTMPSYPAGQAYKLAAGWLIEHAGWKGKRLGKVGMYDKQALVLVNYADAYLTDVIDTYQHVQYDILNKFGVLLEPEPMMYNSKAQIINPPRCQTM